MKLYLTVNRDRKAHNDIIYPGVGKYVESPTWNPDKIRGWATGCFGCSTEILPNQNLPTQDFNGGNIFLEIEVEDKDVVNRPNLYRFRKGKVTREWVIGPKTYKEIWEYLSGVNLVRAGEIWPVTMGMKKEAWGRLEDQALYWAGKFWDVPQEMLKDGWGRLEKKVLISAGMYWPNVTVEMKEEGVKRLQGKTRMDEAMIRKMWKI